MRTPIIGGNWKMNTDRASAATLAEGVLGAAALHPGPEVVVFPPFPYLLPVHEVLRRPVIGGRTVHLGAQDVYHAEKGAFTGEVSPLMLRDCGCTWALVGHSERRHVIGEGDDNVNMKLRSAIAAGLSVILCIGETLHQRETGDTNHINERQTRLGLREVSPEQLARIVIAYEPVWAIGTGKTATPNDAQEAHFHIRRVVADMFGQDAAGRIRIQYGGSMNAANAAALLSMPDIDGGLIGGASLKAEDFGAIIAAAAARR